MNTALLDDDLDVYACGSASDVLDWLKEELTYRTKAGDEDAWDILADLFSQEQEATDA